METVEQIIICPACGHKNPEAAKFCQNDGYPLLDGDPDDPLAGRLVGNYRLLNRIGEGGFGVVYLAEHNNLKTKFAVKILHPQFSANRHIAERFRREALAAGKMRHEHVVSIADFDQAPGIGYYYVMEYLEGATLKSVLDDGQEFSPARILHIARQVTSAMERVHSLRIVHRDLKPENIFLVEEGGVPDYVKLVDFGIAKIMGEEGASLTRTGLSVGTPLYMSPEQARGNLKGLDHRTDIYSWGVILFEMLTYRPPFFSENPHEVVMMQIREIPPRLFEVCPDRQFSSELEALIQRILAKDPERRPRTMLAMYEELEDVLSAPDAIVETGMTQVMDKREEWVASRGDSSTTPTATQSTREILDEETRGPLETTGEQLKAGDSSSTTDEGQDENTLRGTAVLDEDTPDWRAVFDKGELDEADLPDTLAGKKDLPINDDPSLAANQPSVDVHMVPSDENPLPPSSEVFEPEHKTEELPHLSAAPASGFTMSPPLALNESEVSNSSLPAAIPSSLDLDEDDNPYLQSFSTNPDALRSPFQRFSVIVLVSIGVFVALVAGFIYMIRKPTDDTKIDYKSLMGKVGPSTRKVASPPKQRRVIPPLRKRTKSPARRQVQPVTRRDPIVLRVEPQALAPRVAPPRTVPNRALVPKKVLRKMATLNIETRPNSALCYYREGRGRWRDMDECRLSYEVGEAIQVRVIRRGYYSQTKSWLPKQNDSWYIRLRRRSRRARVRNTTRRRIPPPRRRPAVRGDNIFEQTDNPFRDKKKKKK